MRRSGQLRRKTPLRSKPSTSAREGSAGLTGPRTGIRAAVSYRIEQWQWREGLGGCQVCPAEGGECSGPVQGHHCVSRQALKRRGLHAHLGDKRNRLPVCERRHAQHTNAFRPIPRELLPASVFVFAAELGLMHLIDRYYPEVT